MSEYLQSPSFISLTYMQSTVPDRKETHAWGASLNDYSQLDLAICIP